MSNCAPAALALALVLTACTLERPRERPSSVPVLPAVDGLIGPVPLEVPDAELEAVAAASSAVRIVAVQRANWLASGLPVVTATLATLADPAAALAAYNGWFAVYGFLAAAEREPVVAGERALRFELGWPPLHAVIARSGPYFLLVHGDPALPVAERRRVLEEIAGRTLPKKD